MLKTDLFNSIEQHIDSLLTTISTKYNIDKHELKNLWCNLDESTNVENQPQRTEEVTQSVPVTETTSTTTTTEKAYDINNIHDYDVKTLKGILKSLGLKVSGKKADLISRIMNSENEPKKSPSRKSPSKKSSKKKKQTRLLPINGKIELQKRQIHFKKIDNFHVHEDSNLIIDSETKIIIGKYDIDTKSMVNLTENDINICKKYKFRFNMPENLLSDHSKKEDRNKLKDKLSDILKEEEVEEKVEEVEEKVEEKVEEEEVEEKVEEEEVEVEEKVEEEVEEEEVEEEVEVEEVEEEVEVEEVEVEEEVEEEVEVEEEAEVEEGEVAEEEVEEEVDEQLKQKEFEDELDDLLDSDSDIEYEEVVVYE